jgi:hypothetical protein
MILILNKIEVDNKILMVDNNISLGCQCKDFKLSIEVIEVVNVSR